jgi:L-histidine Nalpha-methyltransferase
VTAGSRLTVDVHVDGEAWRARVAAEAVRGLQVTPKAIDPIWFYDARGSALFDEITRLPEYYLTRAERHLLQTHAPDIARTGATTLVELGSGTSEKTRVLLEALRARGTLGRYVPFDIDEATLRSASEAVLAEYPALAVHAIVGDFHEHLGRIPGGDRRLVAFLGSTIGNLGPSERRRLFFDLDCAMTAGDRLLLGVDLVKDTDVLLAAYDDAAGVTAEFNRNALCVLNAELGADFDPTAFDHVAVWNDEEAWIEMRLRARSPQRVELEQPGVTVEFAAGEELRTETSAKFTVEGITAELWEGGFVVEEVWTGPDAAFALLLARPYC